MDGNMQFGELVIPKIIDHAARIHADSGVVSVPPEGGRVELSWVQIRERARHLAFALQELGVRPGDRVATMAFNTHRHLESWYAIMGIGAVCHTLNPRLFLDDLAYIANDAEDSLLLVDATLAPLARQLVARVPSICRVVYLCDEQHLPGVADSAPFVPELAYERILRDAKSRFPAGWDWAPVKEATACGLCYTSGTTGKPKGVLYSHRSNFLHALAASLPDTHGVSAASSITLVVPLFHANAWGIAFAAPAMGARLTLPGPFLDGASLYALLRDTRATFTAGVPTVWLGLMRHMQERGGSLPDLESVGIGGAACPGVLFDFFEGLGVVVRHAWGMTEVSPVGTCGLVKPSVQASERRDRLKRQGFPHVLVDMRVVGPDGKVAPHDGKTNGNIQVRGPHVVANYYKRSEPATDADGWFDTGDVGNLSPDGYMQITDRSKDVIKSGGEWISSIAIETATVDHPAVAEAAVIAMPHPKWTERPLLVVVLRKGATASKGDLVEFLRPRIAKWWLPDDVVFVDELPHTASGKLNKVALRKQLAGRTVDARL